MRFASVTSSDAVSSLWRPTSARKSCRLSPAPMTAPGAMCAGSAGSSRGAPISWPERLELLRQIRDVLVAELELERKRLELGRLDVAALLRVLDERTGLGGLKKFLGGVVAQMILSQSRTCAHD